MLYTTTQGSDTGTGELYGTVDALTPPTTPGGAWSEYVIASFETGGVSGSTLGIFPLAGVVFDGEALFGTNYFAGDLGCFPNGCGAVYQVTRPAKPGAWTVTAIHDFTSAPDGGGSRAALTVGPGGVLYCTTSYGGTGSCFIDGVFSGCGTIFQLTPPITSGGTWTESVIYSFVGLNGDGAYPVASVVLNKNGVLYGTTQFGGSAISACPPSYPLELAGCGTVFELTPPTTPGGAWTETVLHSFSGLSDGSMPVAGLALSKSGVLYGTTSAGGASGQGTVFAIKP